MQSYIEWLFFVFIIITNICKSILYTIKIAHLHPNDSTKLFEPTVLEMCAKDLKKNKILPDDINFQILSMESCSKYKGVANAAYLHFIQNCGVYFGPGCNNEMLIIGRLASQWNLPIIAHLSGDDVLSDRTDFNTLGSVALTSATEMARAILVYIKLYGWKQVGLVRSSINFDRLSLHSLKNFLKKQSIKINYELELDPLMTPEEIISTNLLITLRNKARIIIVEMGMDIHSSSNFMIAAYRSNMKSEDFVYIIPWLAHTQEDYPWMSSNKENNTEIKNAFDNCVFLTAHGYDTKIYNKFQTRFSNITGIVSSQYATFAYMTLYDALYLYGLAIRDAFSETKNYSIFMDGLYIWKKMTLRIFNGSTGRVVINKNAVRVPSYATYYIKNGSAKIVVELTARLLDKYQCSLSKGDCSEHIAHEMYLRYWNSVNGVLPPDIPACGFDGGLCNYTLIYVLAGVIVFLAVAIPLGYFLYLKEKERMLYDMTWRIPYEHVKFLKAEKSKISFTQSLIEKSIIKSFGSTSFAGSISSKVNLKISAQQALVNGVRCSYKRFKQIRNITFTKADLSRLNNLKFIENENLNKFYGICFNQQNEFIVFWILCQRGSLEDVLFNEELKIGQNFQISFAKDVVKGLYFLHSSSLKCHGMLCLQNCLVNSNWNVKLTNFFTEEIINDKLRHNEIRVCSGKENKNKESEKKGKKQNESNKIAKKASDSESSDLELHFQEQTTKIKIRTKKLLQQAPEVIREVIATKHFPPGTPTADMYSLGMILYQILFKVEPFFDKHDSQTKILEKIAMSDNNEQIIRPTFPKQDESYSLQLLSAIEACWLEIPEMRPNIKRLRSIVSANLKSTASGSLVDQMMKMMEDYTTNLEQLVKDRTAMLEDAQQQADRLLKNMLPPSIAEDLKVGKPVLPQIYQNSTVLFSDIRGFTKISATSTPLQIVTFLNDLFSGFDAIIAKHDAYKVETIGDAYMIVSGVPRENGNAHVQHIADIALKMRTFVSNFKLAHKPEEIMMVRIGFHSGSVAAGVVGLVAPRYCLFGDTVNTASRMESTGLGNKIQISEESHNLIKCFYRYFIVVERGLVNIKGKGQCTTFFLEGKEQADKANENV